MPYFPVDDDMPFHPKVLAAGNEAIGMWARAGALCKKYATGGEVSHEMVASLGGKKLAEKLVRAGLWVVIEGGYRFHDWKQQAGNDDAEVEKARVERARERNAARQRAYRERNANGNGVTNAHVTNTPSPSPSPKDLTKTSESSPVPAARDTTDAFELSKTEQSIAGQMGITRLQAIADEVRKHTGRHLDASGCLAVCRHLLDKAPQSKPPRVPQRYVIGAITRSPFEVQQFIDEGWLAS